MKSLKLVCYTALILSIIPAAHARPVHKKASHAARPAVSGIGATLQALYNRSNVSANHKDLDGAMRYFSQDFVMTDRKGNEIDLGEVRFRLSALFDSATSLRSDTVVSGASQHGTTATALIHESTQCVVINPDTGKKGILIDHSATRDTWTHTDDGWMMTHSQQLSSQETLNGHVVTEDDQMTPDPTQNDAPAQGLSPTPNGGD